MKNVKIEKMKGYLEGYKLGDYYLIKNYSWNNQYEWLLSKKHQYYGACEMNKAFDNNEIKLVKNCKNGKEFLIKLYNNEIKFEDIKAMYCL